ERALESLEDMRGQLRRGKQIDSATLDLPRANGGPPGDALYTTGSGKQIRPITPNQKKYVETVTKNDLVIGIGPAGTGKTFLAVVCALASLKAGQVNRIVITRP